MNGEAKPDAKQQYTITGDEKWGIGGGGGRVRPLRPAQPELEGSEGDSGRRFQEGEAGWGREGVEGRLFQEIQARSERWGVSWSVGRGVSGKG